MLWTYALSQLSSRWNNNFSTTVEKLTSVNKAITQKLKWLRRLFSLFEEKYIKDCIIALKSNFLNIITVVLIIKIWKQLSALNSVVEFVVKLFVLFIIYVECSSAINYLYQRRQNHNELKWTLIFLPRIENKIGNRLLHDFLKWS